MGFDAGRVRRGELIAAGGGILLVAVLFVLPWFEVRGPGARLASAAEGSTSLDGWQALTTTRWILLVTSAASVGLLILTGSQRAPAVPVTLSMVACVLGGLSSVLLLYRILDHPGLTARPGVYVGLVAALVLAYGGFLSLRTEGSPFGDPESIETVPIGHAESGAAMRAESTSAGRRGP